MEQRANWRSLKIWTVLLISMVLLIGLFSAVDLVNPEIHFPDPALEQVIRGKIEQPTGPIHRSDVQTITEIHAHGKGIHSLEGLEFFRRLAYLDFENNLIKDLTPISNLHMLVELQLRNNQVSDLQPLSNLTQLRVLDLRGNSINDLIPLAPLTELHYLNIRDNNIADIKPIGNLKKLVYLNLHSNPVEKNLSVVGNLTELETLVLRNIKIGNNIGFLKNLRSLKRLNLRNSNFSDLNLIINLMEQGVLQDDIINDKVAHLNLLDNPLPSDPKLLFNLQPYWDNIYEKYPIVLNSNTLDLPNYSHESGYYSLPFYLEISTTHQNGIVHFTTDGKTPDMNSSIYTEPILISDNCSFLNDNVSPQILRLRVIDKITNEKSQVVSLLFFVGDCLTNKHSLPVLSLTTDPMYLFSKDFGILGGNVFKRGKKWERPAQLELLNSYGDSKFKDDIYIRVHGVYSRGLPQTPLRLYAENNYGKQEFLNYEFFPGNKNKITNQPIDKYASLILRNAGDDWHNAYMRDILVQSLYSHLNIDQQMFQSYVLYLNAEYWGIYHLRERIDHFFISQHNNIAPDNILLVEYDYQKGFSGDPDGMFEYNEIYEFIKNNELSFDSNYEYISQQIDIDNFIDFYVLNIYSSNYDWPHNNNKFWRIKPEAIMSNGPKASDGLWRWIVNDLDRAFTRLDENTLQRATSEYDRSGLRWPSSKSTFLFRSLLENDKFSQLFINRFADHLNTTFKTERVIENIDAIEELLLPEIEEQTLRWGNLGGSLQTWQDNVEMLRNFASARPDIQRQHLKEFFNLGSQIELGIINRNMNGFVVVNSIEINEDSIGVNNPKYWSGIYYSSIPITITAFPNQGYRFSHWIGLESYNTVDHYSDSIEFILQDDLKLEPIFVEID